MTSNTQSRWDPSYACCLSLEFPSQRPFFERYGTQGIGKRKELPKVATTPELTRLEGLSSRAISFKAQLPWRWRLSAESQIAESYLRSNSTWYCILQSYTYRKLLYWLVVWLGPKQHLPALELQTHGSHHWIDRWTSVRLQTSYPTSFKSKMHSKDPVFFNRKCSRGASHNPRPLSECWSAQISTCEKHLASGITTFQTLSAATLSRLFRFGCCSLYSQQP